MPRSVLLARLHAEVVLERRYPFDEVCDFICWPGLQMLRPQLFYAVPESFKLCIHCPLSRETRFVASSVEGFVLLEPLFVIEVPLSLALVLLY